MNLAELINYLCHLERFYGHECAVYLVDGGTPILLVDVAPLELDHQVNVLLSGEPCTLAFLTKTGHVLPFQVGCALLEEEAP